MWKKYRIKLIITLGFVAWIFIIASVHQDYVQFQQITRGDEASLAWSFVLKWLTYLLSLALYLWLIWREPKPTEATKTNTKTTSSHHPPPVASTPLSTPADPFQPFRRNTLRSKAQQIIDGKPER